MRVRLRSAHDHSEATQKSKIGKVPPSTQVSDFATNQARLRVAAFFGSYLRLEGIAVWAITLSPKHYSTN